ncbi:MAG: pantoate--beta-alanine ligase [Saprospiraceae bacterium]|nr:pantoate--beta-alanine ligase [Saprospiraceae bacterium]
MTKGYTRWNSLPEARAGLNALRASGKTIGSIHSLGALHEGHGKVIQMAAKENDCVVVSVYPNAAQLAPGSVYQYDAEADCDFAHKFGATHLICPDTSEMYPPEYRTFFDQGEYYKRLDGTVVPYLFRGMITMSTRWIIFTRPTRTYWGLKDIGQTILVNRAVKDLLIDTEVREVPCVRYKSGIAISSRLMNQPEAKILEFQRVYEALEVGRKAIANGLTNSEKIIKIMHDHLSPSAMKYFSLKYIKIAKPLDFEEPSEIDIPLIMHIVVSDGPKNYFEGHYIRSQSDLINGPDTIWLDDHYPPFKE